MKGIYVTMTLACWITSTRFILAPLIYWQLSSGTPNGLRWALSLLLLAGITDLLDGWAARSRNEVTELGKLLDPLTDKLTIFVMLLALTRSWGLPGWLVTLYAGKELLQVVAGAFLIKNFQQLIPANRWGKNSTFGFFCGCGLFFLNRTAGAIVLSGALLLSVYALYTYYQAYLELKQKKQ
jgi:cardiolipin synthase